MKVLKQFYIKFIIGPRINSYFLDTFEKVPSDNSQEYITIPSSKLQVASSQSTHTTSSSSISSSKEQQAPTSSSLQEASAYPYSLSSSSPSPQKQEQQQQSFAIESKILLMCTFLSTLFAIF